MNTRQTKLSEREKELVSYLVKDCKSTGDIQEKLKRLFAGTIEQILEAETEEHLGYATAATAGMAMAGRRLRAITESVRLQYREIEMATLNHRLSKRGIHARTKSRKRF